MTVKRIFINIIIVVVIVFVLDYAIGSALRYFYFKETSGVHYRTTYAMESADAEVLVFGSSRANHHYVPEIFEDSLKKTFYNTGRDGIEMFYHTALLKSILKRYKPQIIILDYAGTFDKSDAAYDRLTALLPYYKTHEEVRDIAELKSPFEKFKLMSQIYPFNSEVLAIAMGNLESNKKRKSDNKGYVALNKEWQNEIDSVGNIKKYETDPVKIAVFKEFLSLAKNSGAEVFVIYSPVFKKTNMNQEIDICKEICDAENIPFWDYSRDSTFLSNKKLFQDVEHLNNAGAVLFSDFIVKRMKENKK